MTLHSIQRSLQGFDLMSEVREAIKETSEEIIKYNQSQLSSGIRSTGSEIKPEYTDFTVEMKKAKGQPFNQVTLKDEGDFYREMFVDVNSETFEIDSKNWKTLALVYKYQPSILGLTKENKMAYVDYTFFPALKVRIETRLQVKLT